MPHTGTHTFATNPAAPRHHTHTSSSKMATIHNAHTHCETEKPGPVSEVIHALSEIPDCEGVQELPALEAVMPTNKQHSLEFLSSLHVLPEARQLCKSRSSQDH